MRLGSALSISEPYGGVAWESFAAYPVAVAEAAGDPTPISPGARGHRHNNVADVSALARLDHLRELFLTTDISALAQLTDRRILFLPYNEVADIDPPAIPHL